MPRNRDDGTAAGTAVRSRSERVERYLLQVIVTGCVIFGLFGALTTVASSLSVLTSDPVTVTDMPMSVLFESDDPSASVLYVGDTDTSVAAVDDLTADVPLSGLPAGIRWLLVSAAALPSLAGLALAVLIAFIAIGVLRGRPFSTGALWSLVVYAAVYMLSAWGHNLLLGSAHGAIVEFLSPDAPAYAYSVSFPAEPFAWVVALAVVAGAFEIGRRMQRDTEGLI